MSPTLGLVLALVVAAGIAAFFLWRRRRDSKAVATPMLLFEVRKDASKHERLDSADAPGHPSRPPRAPSETPSPAEIPPLEAPTHPPGNLPSETVIAGPVSFERAQEGTLQLLPGRFVIESDAGRGEEIRFVRVPGTPAQVTFGRSPGPAHRHVQLSSLTVSRVQAELTFDEGVWTLRNHSATNPTVVNDRSLGSQVHGVELQDGDRVEMGGVVFLFRHPQDQDRLATRSSWYTDRGLRPMNQDALVVRSLPGSRELAAVCDGMGSHEAGGVASRIALEALTGALERGAPLEDAVRHANKEVREAATKDPELEGAGTTLVALLREGDRYMVVNVGDSRAYVLDSDGIRLLTRDHSFVAEAVASGEMSEEEALRSPWRHAITRNLGGSGALKVDLFSGMSPERPHVVVLCTDGIHNVLDNDAIEAVVRGSPHIRDTARLLCEEALCQGTQDNVSAAVMAFAGGIQS